MKAQRMNRSKMPKKANTDTPTPTTQAAPAQEIPPELSHLAGVTPAQAILAMFPKAKGHPEGEAAIAGLFSGIPDIDFGTVGIVVPEWAQKASNLYWKSTGLPLHKPISEWTPEEAGKFCGVIEEGTPEAQVQNDVTQEMQKTSDAFLKQIKTAIDDDAREVAHKFYGGRVKATKVADKMSNPAQRTQIFFFIALGWQQVEKFKGQMELWKWLTKEHESGKQMVSEWAYTDPMREMREVCQLIGLKFKNRSANPPLSS